MVDVSVVCSCCPSYLQRCSHNPDAELRHRAQQKVAQYRVLAVAQGHQLAPVVFDALGVPSIGAARWVSSLVEAAVANGVVSDSARPFFTNASLTKMAFAVQQGNMLLFRECWPAQFPLALLPAMPPLEVDSPSQSPAPAAARSPSPPLPADAAAASPSVASEELLSDVVSQS